MITRRQLIAGAAPAALGAADAVRWRTRFFHDEDQSAMRIVDLQAPAAGTAIATAFLGSKREPRPSPLLLRTVDDGKTWRRIALKEPDPTQVFCLDAKRMWLAGESIWKSEDGGETWTRISRLKRALRIHFLDELHGVAAGVPKALWTTADGGKTWTAVPDEMQPKARKEYAGYSVIAFQDAKRGLVVGASQPPRRRERKAPSWMDPETPDPATPISALILETRDAGQTWAPQVTSVFGQITQLVFNAKGDGLGLLEYERDFTYASEVYQLVKGKTARSFRDKSLAPRDVTFVPGGGAWIAAVDVPGKLTQVPIPGKVRMFFSLDQATWTESPVDYRAAANRVYLAASPTGEAWAATDLGMILKASTA